MGAPRTIRRRLLAALCFALGAVGAAGVHAHGVTLEVYHPLSADSTFHRSFLVPWTQKVEKAAGGRVRFHLHPGAPAAGLYDQVLEGKADLVWTAVSASPERFPRVMPFEQPFVARSAQRASRALAEYARVNDLPDRDFDGVRLLAAHVGTGAQLHWRTAEAATGGVKGKRIAVQQAPDKALVAAMGATAVETPAARIAEVLNQGGADGALLAWEQLTDHGLTDAVRAHSEAAAGGEGLGTSVYVFAMSAGSYRTLPDDIKAVFETNSGESAAAWLGGILDEAAAASRKASADRGDPVEAMAAEEQAQWRQAAKAVADARVQAMEKAGVRIRLLLDSAREYLDAAGAQK